MIFWKYNSAIYMSELFKKKDESEKLRLGILRFALFSPFL